METLVKGYFLNFCKVVLNTYSKMASRCKPLFKSRIYNDFNKHATEARADYGRPGNLY